MDAMTALDFDVRQLPVDVFDVSGSGLGLDSLTTGHGMFDNGASSCGICGGCSACSMVCSCGACASSNGNCVDWDEGEEE
ncbi:thiomuracin/GE37468 family thiazolyl RiPP peptide [Nonomuraea sp. KM88]|uniref:thiomuracin/GE37468 family thiazolyl RiPP peptide n=1 Tax=Nonomuraea sp. KM88 TaxID=3457427 RepID=UPI003FCD9BA4